MEFFKKSSTNDEDQMKKEKARAERERQLKRETNRRLALLQVELDVLRRSVSE